MSEASYLHRLRDGVAIKAALHRYLETDDVAHLDEFTLEQLRSWDEDQGEVGMNEPSRFALRYQIKRREMLNVLRNNDMTHAVRVEENLIRLNKQMTIMLDYLAVLVGEDTPPKRNTKHD